MHKSFCRFQIPILFSFFSILGLTAQGQSTTSGTTVAKVDDARLVTPGARVSTELLVPLLESKATSKKERLQALHAMYQAKELLSKPEQLEFWRGTKTVASDKAEDARLRADAIWVLGGMGMMLKHEKTWTQEDISRECEFLLQTAADTSETLQVRRMSIAALGDLKMKEAVPVVKALLADKANLNRPEIARSASIALAELAPEEALEPIGQVLSETTNPAVFGSAAYALGRINSPNALPLLVRNRLRLGDNLSVDNAIEATSGTVIALLKKPSDPKIVSAIQATRSLWREEQKATYSPLLREILADKTLPPEARREALKRLMEDADALPLDARKESITLLLSLVEGDDLFPDQVARMRLILNAQILPATRIKGQDKEEVAR
jgi:hypothetical protein